MEKLISFAEKAKEGKSQLGSVRKKTAQRWVGEAGTPLCAGEEPAQCEWHSAGLRKGSRTQTRFGSSYLSWIALLGEGAGLSSA